MKNKLILILILILGFGVRLYKINNPIADWHSWRQADTSSVTRTYVEKGINLLLPKYHDISSIQTGIFNPEGYRMVEFPVYNAIHALLYTNFPSHSLEVWGRILSAICAVLSGLMLFLIGKKVLNERVGLMAAFIYLFIPYNIYFTRVILPEPFGVLMALIGMYLYISGRLYVSALFFALALLIKPFFIFYFIPLLFISHKDIKKNFAKYVIFGFLAFAPLLIWRFWIRQFPEGIPFFAWAFNGDRIRFHLSFFRWIFGERLGILILGGWGLIPLAFSIVKKENLFVKFFLLGMLMYVVTIATASVRHDYYQIIAIPAIALAIASGLEYMFTEKIFSRHLSLLVGPFSIFIMLIIGYYQVSPFYRVNHPEIMEAGEEIDKLTPKDAIVVAPYNGDTAFLYQTKRWGWPAVDDSIDHIIEKGADYYVSVDLGSADSKNFEKMFATVKKTDKYIILDLHKKLK